MAAPAPNLEDSRDNAAFEALLWAMARPGEIRALPEPGAAPILLALIDREVSVFAEQDDMRALAAQTGASTADRARADFVFAALERADWAREVKAGTDLHPEDGATLVAPARFGAGARLRLTGPGIETAREIAVEGIDPAFWAIRAAHPYPLGIDLILHDGAQAMALPRSTQVETL